MPEVSSCSVSNRDDLTCVDPSGAPPTLAPLPVAGEASSCYACLDAVPAPATGAVSALVAAHDGPHTVAAYHGQAGDFSFVAGQASFESSNDGAGLGVTALRAGVEGPVAVEVEALSAGADAGFYNLDGSKGYHAGAHAALAHGETTLGRGTGWSLTFGAGVGIEAEASLGVNDADHDGRRELCARIELEAVIGACLEPADVTDAAVALEHAAGAAVESVLRAFDGATAADARE
jgi:hypothetical protein